LTKYTKSHEYIKVDGDVGTVGITNYAQSALGDVVYVGVPDVGAKYKKGCVIYEIGVCSGILNTKKCALYRHYFTPHSNTLCSSNATAVPPLPRLSP